MCYIFREEVNENEGENNVENNPAPIEQVSLLLYFLYSFFYFYYTVFFTP